MVLHRTAS